MIWFLFDGHVVCLYFYKQFCIYCPVSTLELKIESTLNMLVHLPFWWHPVKLSYSISRDHQDTSVDNSYLICIRTFISARLFPLQPPPYGTLHSTPLLWHLCNQKEEVQFFGQWTFERGLSRSFTTETILALCKNALISRKYSLSIDLTMPH